MKKSNKPIIEYIPDYLDWIDVEKSLSTKTQENYSRFIKRFVDWLEIKKLSHMTPDELTSELVFEYRIFLARKTKSKRDQNNLKKSTQNYYLIAIRSLLSYFAEQDILAIPPEKIRLGRNKKDKEIRFLSIKELKRLFDMPDVSKDSGLRDKAILETFFSTGMRLSELVALNREQVEHSLGSDSLELGIIGKGGKARVVYFSSRALHAIKEYLNKRKDTHAPLFINYKATKGSSRRLTPRSIEKIIKRYAILAGLPPNTTPHVLRHSFATDLLSKGVDIRVLQEFLGHSHIAATQIYAHVTNKQLKDIHKKYHSGDDLG